MRCVVCGVWCVVYMVFVWRETVLGGRVCANVNVNVSMYVHLEGGNVEGNGGYGVIKE